METSKKAQSGKRYQEDPNSEYEQSPFKKIHTDSPVKQYLEKDMDIVIGTWNINHLSVETDEEKYKEKLEALELILKNMKPDLLVLQEVNNIPKKEEVKEGEFIGLTEKQKNNYIARLNLIYEVLAKEGYDWDLGCQMKTQGTKYIQKYGIQYEYYPLIYLKDKFKVEETKAISIENFKPQNETENKSEYNLREKPNKFQNTVEKEGIIGWTQGRPLLVREISIKGWNPPIYLGSVHTSPDRKISNSIAYVGKMEEYLKNKKAGNNRFIIAGDWYVEENDTLTVNDEYNVAYKWSKYLKSKGMKLVLPCSVNKNEKKLWDKNFTCQTNFPHQGKGMKADYFVVPTEQSDTPCVVLIAKGNNPNCWPSDHAPVFAKFTFPFVENISKQKSLFALSAAYDLTFAMSDEPMLLNGMKVLFDNPTPTTPVTLQPKQRGTNNGR